MSQMTVINESLSAVFAQYQQTSLVEFYVLKQVVGQCIRQDRVFRLLVYLIADCNIKLADYGSEARVLVLKILLIQHRAWSGSFLACIHLASIEGEVQFLALSWSILYLEHRW